MLFNSEGFILVEKLNKDKKDGVSELSQFGFVLFVWHVLKSHGT